MYGGDGQFIYNFNKWIGAVGDFGAVNKPNVGIVNAQNTTAFAYAGPRFLLSRHRLSPFGQVLFGGAFRHVTRRRGNDPHPLAEIQLYRGLYPEDRAVQSPPEETASSEPRPAPQKGCRPDHSMLGSSLLSPKAIIRTLLLELDTNVLYARTLSSTSAFRRLHSLGFGTVISSVI